MDIKDYINQCPRDNVKHHLISNREPEKQFNFPPKQYKDKRSRTGYMNRFCCRDWLKKFEFTCYSKHDDGLYCLACVLFPDGSHRRPKKLITEPYRNWKDAIHDLKKHATCEYHMNSMAKLKSFNATYAHPSTRVDMLLSDEITTRVQKNRDTLASIIKCIEACGRQGIALRGHRDDDTSASFNKGNFKALIELRVDAGDKVLEDHLNSCKKNAKYTSKTAQNDFLLCIKQFIQDKIIEDIKNQTIGPYYGIQCDEVSDSSNWEQLGLVLRYIKNNKPVERLFEFIPCEKITGEALCQKIIQSLTTAGLDIQYCRSQTMDGAGNMAGRQKGCAACFTKHSPKAVYQYCSSHDLNLALCKSCKLKEVHNMLDALKQLGIFFKYSPKRTRRLESAVDEVNAVTPKEDHINTTKFRVFCETRWVEKHTTLNDFDVMYEPLLVCLEAIGSLETDWDSKSSGDAYGLMKRITDSTFIASFQTVLHFFGYVRGLSAKLQGSTLGIIGAYKMIDHVRSLLSTIRNDVDTEFKMVWEKMCKMAEKAHIASLECPRQCSRQTQRNNIPAESSQQYFKRAIFIPFLDSILEQFSMRFSNLAQRAAYALTLVPCSSTTTCASVHVHQPEIDAILDFYGEDMPASESFVQELKSWQHMWNSVEDAKPSTLSQTLMDDRVCPVMYPNITKIMSLFLLTSVTTSDVERANSSLRYIKNSFRSTMGQDRFNALILLYIHKDIALDVHKIIDMYAQRHPRRMTLLNPLSL